MSQMLGIVLVTAWLLEAIALGYGMRRRGYDGYNWLLLGLTFGPLALPIAIASPMHPAQPAPPAAHSDDKGGLRILVGADGSAESLAAVSRARSMFAGRIEQVTIARVIPIDAPPATERAAMSQLRRSARFFRGLTPHMVVLRGEPVQALRDRAALDGADVIVVGARGAGLAKVVLGSVAQRLSAGGPVPVLIVDQPAQRGRHAA